MECEADHRPLGVFKCQLCALTAPYSYVGQKPPDTQSVVSAVYSIPRGFASPVSGRTSMPSLGKFGKTWGKGKIRQRSLPASLVRGHECSLGQGGG